VKRALLLALAGAAVLAAGARSATTATRECNGLMVCVPVAGPWVAVPTGAAGARPQTQFQLSCPRGYIVGGLDAELSSRQIDVVFDARLGSPVNPGVSTTRDALFRATKGTQPGTRASFRPHIGCIPTNGGGGTRPPTAVRPAALPTALAAIYPPGQPVVRHVKNVELRPQRPQRIAAACARGEHLVEAWRAIGFYTIDPPTPAQLRTVRTTLAVKGDRVKVGVRNTLQIGAGATVQVGVVCGGGK